MSEHARRAHVILGASGGIGAATSRQLAAAGAKLWLASRASDRLSALADELQATTRELDATEFDAVGAGQVFAVDGGLSAVRARQARRA